MTTAFDFLQFADEPKFSIGEEGEDGNANEAFKSTLATPPGQSFLVVRIGARVTPFVAPPTVPPRVNVYRGRVDNSNWIGGSPDARIWESNAGPILLRGNQFITWHFLNLALGSTVVGFAYGLWINR